MAFRKVAQFKEMSLKFASTGGLSDVYLYTDLPGNVMTQRLTGKTLSNTGGGSSQKVETIPLDGIEGTMFRPEIAPRAGTVLRLYEGTIWLRTIGVYLDGSIGEKFATQDISIGV